MGTFEVAFAVFVASMTLALDVTEEVTKDEAAELPSCAIAETAKVSSIPTWRIMVIVVVFGGFDEALGRRREDSRQEAQMKRIKRR